VESEETVQDNIPRTRIAIKLRGNPHTLYDVYENPGKADEALAKLDDDISTAHNLAVTIKTSSGEITFPKTQFISAYID
jgi:hypothetical protein